MPEVFLRDDEATIAYTRTIPLENVGKLQLAHLINAWTSMVGSLINVPAVLPLSSVSIDQTNRALCLSFKDITGISLRELLSRHRSANCRFPEQAIFSYVMQLLSGIDALEKLSITPDISLDSIFVMYLPAPDPCENFDVDEDGDSSTCDLIYGECFMTVYNPDVAYSQKPLHGGHDRSAQPLTALTRVVAALCNLDDANESVECMQAPALSPESRAAYSRELRIFIRACSQCDPLLRPTAQHLLRWLVRVKAALANYASRDTEVPTVFSMVTDRVSRPPSPGRSVSPSRMMSHPDYSILLSDAQRTKAYLNSSPNKELVSGLLETAIALRNVQAIALISKYMMRTQTVVPVKSRRGDIVMKETALMSAARTGNVSRLTHYLKHSPEMLGAVFCGDTALRIAARHGHFLAASLLLGELGVQSPAGWTALMSAAQHGHDDIVAILLSESGVQLENGLSAMMLAAKHGHAACIQRLSPLERRLTASNGESAADFVEESFRVGLIDEAVRKSCLEALVLE